MSNILITMIEVGFGHKGPALAIKNALDAAYPGQHSINVIDFPLVAGAKRTDKTIKSAWNMALRRPWMVRLSYTLMEAVYPLCDRVLYPFMADFFIQGARYLAEHKPDLVVSTHPMCSLVAANARRRYGLRFPLVIDVVDPFDGYSLWAERTADLFLVHSVQSKELLVQHGIEAQRIKLVPYPRLPAMTIPSRSKEEIRRSWGIEPDGKPVILVTSGAQGIGRVYSFVRRAYQADLPAYFFVVTGKNRKLYTELELLAQTGSLHPLQIKKNNSQNRACRLIPLSFVESMAELYYICDIVVGKAGASTCMEALFHQKPLVCTEWAGQNDYKIVEFLLQNNLGSFTPRYHDFLRLLKAPPVYEKYSSEFSTYGILEALRSFHVVSGSM
ncbi:glycosyltransferase [Gracilinema caldarium]|uniref:glycosyltransferase n=1 Tax=Gracilinema caldarium TaxID=215591 RepID=UPI0026F20C3F|nr:glycosyltransferase [Gracilinema caldarium]